MPGRKFNTPTYRYGFNGKEKEDEIANAESAYDDFGARIYDARLGRFISKDPFERFTHNKSTYCFAGNSPIAFIDLNGGFQFKPGEENKYPELRGIVVALSNYVNRANATVNDPLIQQFIVQAGIPGTPDEQLSAVRSILTFGYGPTISVEDLGPDAGAVDIPMNQQPIGGLDQDIKINITLVNQLKTLRKSDGSKMDASEQVANKILAFMTLWHEGIHYMDLMVDGIAQDFNYQTQQTNPVDIGDQATQNVFGYGGTGVVNPKDIADDLRNQTFTGGQATFGSNRRMNINLFFQNNRIPTTGYPGHSKTGKSENKKSGKSSHQNVRFL